MFSSKINNKSSKSLKLLNSSKLLSKVFSYVPKKISIQILRINKKLSNSLNLTIKDYLLDKQFQEIINDSKGNLNYIFLQSFSLSQQLLKEKELNSPFLSFTQLISKIIKYLNYIYATGKCKTFFLSFDLNIYNSWMYFTFLIEVIRHIKCGLSLIMNSSINYRYYEVIKDAIENLNEIHSVSLYISKNDNEKMIQDYFKIFDWRKVKSINFSGSVFEYDDDRIKIKDISILDNSSFRKLVINDRSYYNTKNILDLIYKHGQDIEYLKINNFSDIFFFKSGENKIIKQSFDKLVNLKKLKFIKCRHLFFFNILPFLNKNFTSIKVLNLDNVSLFNKDNCEEVQNNFQVFLKTLDS